MTPESPGTLQRRQQFGMQAVPDPGLLPGPQASVRRAAGAAGFGLHVLPAGAGGEHEPDDPDDDPVFDPGPAALGPTGRSGGR